MLAVMGLMTLKAQAVGLGELVVHSKLGEPLTAEIQVIQSNGEFIAADDLIVNIATENEHAKRSLDGYLARQTLQLKLAETLNDDVSLKLSSNRPINEPFLNFLVELKWNAGRIIKEFTVLLDPPGFKPEKIATETAAIETTSVVTESTGATTQTYRFAQTKNQITDTPFSNGQYGPVQKGETLSEIAMRVRPAGYSIALVDMIDAIYKNNQEAFINGDKNLLQRDVVLSIPTANEVISLTNTHSNSNTTQVISTPSAIEPAVVHFASSSQSTDLTSSYTVSGLKLSTELNRSFLEAVQVTQIESTSPENESNQIPIEIQVSSEAPGTVYINSDEFTQEAVVEPIITAPNENNTPAIVSEDVVTIKEETYSNESQPEANVYEPTVTSNELETNGNANTEVGTSSNPFYLIISIIGGILFLTMSVLLFYLRRNRDEDFRPNINLNTNTAEVIPARVFVKEEFEAKSIDAKPIDAKPIDEAPVETAKESVTVTPDAEEDELMDMEQTISEKTEHIATVVMSPEEFEEVGVDINHQDVESTYTEKDDEELINDFLDTIELPDNVEDEPILEEHSDFSIIETADDGQINSESEETFVDISIPLNHNDNEVNTIINEILVGELGEENTKETEELDSLVIDSENNFIEIPESTNSGEDDLLLKTITEDIANIKTELVDLDSQIEQEQPSIELESLELDNEEIEEPEVLDSPNIEDLVVNFQTSNPEKEFEKQVSVFMAYGDYVGAEEVIEKALKQAPENNTYRLAQLSLFKATGKFGAALVLSEELNLIKHELSEIEQKKLELLSDDLNQADDDNSINFAS